MADRDPKEGVLLDALNRAADRASGEAATSSPTTPTPAMQQPAGRYRGPARTAMAIALSVIATIVGLILLTWAVLFVTKGRFLKGTFERIASQSSQRQVRVAGDFQFYFNPIDLKFVAEGLSVSNPAWTSQRNLFSARRIDLDGATIPFIFGRRRIDRLELTDGHLDLEWDKAGRNSWTLGDPDALGEPLDLPVIRRGVVTGTTVRYRDPKLLLATDIRVDTIRATDTRFAQNVRFAGDGTIRSRPFTLSGALLSPNETVTGGRNRLTLSARAHQTAMDVTGTLPAATQIEGADLRIAVRGRNLAGLFDLMGVAIPATRNYRFTSNLTRQDGEWRFTRLAGRFGASDLAGGMTVAMPQGRLRLTADLKSDTVDIIDVGPFIGYDPDKLDAQGGKGAIEQVGGRPRLLPDAPLRIESIRNFDAHVVYAVRRIRADNLPVSDLSMTVDLDRSLLRLSPIAMNLAGGHLTGDVGINARATPVVTNYDIRLATTPLGRLLRGWGVEESGTTGAVRARVTMKGEGDTLHDSLATSDGRMVFVLPAGTFWTRNIQLSELDIGTFVTKMFQDKLMKPVEVNCGLIAFTVRDGIATADPILIDTEKNVMIGRGGFSFKDESLDMRFRADGKKFSLFSGQSPVGIGGYFAKPALNVISPQLLARGGAGIGLAAAVSPVAAVLAFVDVGDAKSASCGPVLAGAQASAQRTSKGKPRDDVGTGRSEAKAD